MEALRALKPLDGVELPDTLWEKWKEDPSLQRPRQSDDGLRIPFFPRTEVRLHANGKDYHLVTGDSESDSELHAWLDAFNQVRLVEATCPTLRFGYCRVGPSTQPIGFQIINYEPGEPRVARLVEDLRTPIRDCALSTVPRTPYRNVYALFKLALESTTTGSVVRLAGLPPAMRQCTRNRLAGFHHEPVEFTGALSIEFVVADFCGDSFCARVPDSPYP